MSKCFWENGINTLEQLSQISICKTKKAVSLKHNKTRYVISCFSCGLFFATLWTVARQAPVSMGFPRQEYRSGLPSPTSGNLLDPWIELICLTSAALAGRFFTTRAT